MRRSTRSDIQGMAVTSFSLAPDTAVDLAWRLGLSLRWLLQDTNGGSSSMNMLGHALRGVETGAASPILVVAGDATGLGGYAKIAANYNIATREHLAPLGHGGPERRLFAGDDAADEQIRAARNPTTATWPSRSAPGRRRIRSRSIASR